MTVAVVLFRMVAFVPYCFCTSCGAFVTSLRCILLPYSTIKNVIFNMWKKNQILTFFGVFLLLFFINYLTYQYLKSVLISHAIDLLHIFFLLVTPVLLPIFLFLLMIVNRQHLSPMCMYQFINKMCE